MRVNNYLKIKKLTKKEDVRYGLRGSKPQEGGNVEQYTLWYPVEVYGWLTEMASWFFPKDWGLDESHSNVWR